MDPAALYEIVHAFTERLASQPRFRPEYARAWREFFGADGDALAAPPERGRPAHTRFCEWFVLERPSDAIGDVPVRLMADLTGTEPPEYDALLGSRVGIYLVTAVGEDATVLRDLQTGRDEDLGWRDGLDLAIGDLLVGRLFPDHRARCVPSAAVAVVPRGEALGDALQRDLAANELPHRLHQGELEHLLFRRWEATQAARRQAMPVEHLEAKLDTLLRSSGALRHSATEISTALRDSGTPGPVMGPLLEEIAFETQADLEALRVLLLDLWNAHHVSAFVEPGAEPGPDSDPGSAGMPAEPIDRVSAAPELPSGFKPREGESLGEALARRIEQGLAAHEDIEQVYAEVEQLLGEPIDDEEEDDVPLVDPSDVARGDLDALVAEFLWEEKCGDGIEGRVLGLLVRQLCEAPVPKVDLEYVEAKDLLRLLVKVFLGSAPPEREAAVRATFGVLERFYRWAERTQEYALGDVLTECSDRFVNDVARLARVSRALSSTDAPTASLPILMRVEAVRDGEIELQHAAHDAALVAVGGGATDDLQVGDIVLGVLRIERGDIGTLDGMAVVLPGGCESLLG